MSQKVQNREIRRKMARERADACIACLDERRCDYTLLFLLGHWDLLSLNRYGRDLISFITCDMKMTREEVCVSAFHNRVLEVFERRGIQSVSSHEYFPSFTKARALERLETVKWRKPYYPFVFQPRTPPSGGCFVICKTWQDGIALLRDTMVAREFDFDGRKIPAVNCYEHMWFSLTHMFVDWELDVNKFPPGEQTVDSLTALADKFPDWFYDRLVQLKAVDPESDVLSVVAKIKTRGTKVSFHYTVNLLGISNGNLAKLARAISQPLREVFAEYDKTKSFYHLAGQTDLCPGIGWDQKTTHGRHQFSTMFGCKPGETNYPHLDRQIDYGDLVDGKTTILFDFRGPHTPTHHHSLYLLYHSCYSIPKPNSITPSGSFVAQTCPDVFEVRFCLLQAARDSNPL
jgi:hypothetical protein